MFGLMFDLRNLEATGLATLTATEVEVLRSVADGQSPREISVRVGMPEDALYRLVTWAIDEVEPAPAGMTMADVHAANGSRPASLAELAEFEAQFGASLPADGEG